MNPLASFGVGGFLLLGWLIFYSRVWVPEQKRQEAFNRETVTSLKADIADLRTRLEKAEAKADRAEERSIGCERREFRLREILRGHNIPIPEPL